MYPNDGNTGSTLRANILVWVPGGSNGEPVSKFNGSTVFPSAPDDDSCPSDAVRTV